MTIPLTVPEKIGWTVLFIGVVVGSALAPVGHVPVCSVVEGPAMVRKVSSDRTMATLVDQSVSTDWGQWEYVIRNPDVDARLAWNGSCDVKTADTIAVVTFADGAAPCLMLKAMAEIHHYQLAQDGRLRFREKELDARACKVLVSSGRRKLVECKQ